MGHLAAGHKAPPYETKNAGTGSTQAGTAITAHLGCRYPVSELAPAAEEAGLGLGLGAQVNRQRYQSPVARFQAGRSLRRAT